MIDAALHYYHTYDDTPLWRPNMTIELNHTIIAVRDRVLSANFLAEILGLPAPVPFGPFMGFITLEPILLCYEMT